MNEFVRSPWLNIALGIMGLIVGYTVVVLQQDSAFAAAQACPADHTCIGTDCDAKEKCTHGRCTEECAGNCPSNS